MECEYCNNDQDGTFGSGRFCNRSCSNGFSTKAKRKEINEKVSQRMSGRKSAHSFGFKKGYDSRRRVFSDEDRKRASKAVIAKYDKIAETLPFEKWTKLRRKSFVLNEQNNKCLCGIFDWNSGKLVLELDHIDGNKKNNIRENLRCLCPNCHSQTPTFRKSWKYKNKPKYAI